MIPARPRRERVAARRRRGFRTVARGGAEPSASKSPVIQKQARRRARDFTVARRAGLAYCTSRRDCRWAFSPRALSGGAARTARRSWLASARRIFWPAPWALKFLWSPWIDAHGWARFGRRRVSSSAAMLTVAILAALSFTDPAHSLAWIVIAAFAGNAVPPRQDIATDGLAVDMLRENERGVGNGVQVGAHRHRHDRGRRLLLVSTTAFGWSGCVSWRSAAMLAGRPTVPILFHRQAPATPSRTASICENGSHAPARGRGCCC